MQALPTEKITKKPIPDEHVILKTTFEDLIQRCLSSAADPVCPPLLSALILKYKHDLARELGQHCHYGGELGSHSQHPCGSSQLSNSTPRGSDALF